MATIYSDYGSGLIHPIRNWNDISTWTGGVIPTKDDTVYIKGYRTTINMTSFGPWTGNKTITVGSTTGYPASGYFYTYTDRGKRLKIDYTSLTGTTFVGCVVDSSYQPFTNGDYYTGGNIINGYYVHSPAPIIRIPVSVVASSLTLIVETGGYLNLYGGELWIYDYVGIRDGRFIVELDSIIRYKKIKLNSAFCVEGYSLQEVRFEGEEVRSNSVLNTECNIGDYRLNCDTSPFGVGDLISVYNDENTIIINRNSFNSYSDNGQLATCNGYYSSDFNTNKIDEGFVVADKDTSYLYLKTRSGLETIINSCQNIDASNQYIIVDERRFKVGESVLIDKSKYDILEIGEEWSLVKDCDFTAGSTLSDWTTDATLHPYSANWSISSNLLKYTSGSYGMLLLKDVYLKEFKIEAWISPLDGYSSGTRSGEEFGIVFNVDPTCARHSAYAVNGYTRGILAIEDTNDRFVFAARYGGYSDNNIGTLTSFNMRTVCREAFKLTVEYTFPIIKFYINDIYISEKITASESMTGLFGLFSDGNSRMTCQRFKVYKPISKLKIQSTTNLSGLKCSQTNAEYYHSAGCKVVKIASHITNPEGHTNLAWSNAGFYDGTWKFPTINGINGNVNNITYPFYFLNNLNNVESYYYDLGSGADKYFTVDLGYAKYFTHVAYTNWSDYAYINNLLGIQIFASADNSTWTEIYAKQADNRLSTYKPSLRYYQVTAGTWRYLKISVSGSNVSTRNYATNIGVFDFTNGYQITVNNANDFNIGDYVTILSHSYFGGNNLPSLESSVYTTIANGTLTKDSYISKLKNYYTITNKVGNTLTFAEPITNTFLNGDEYVVKVNRNIKILNDISANYSKGNFYRSFSPNVKCAMLVMNNVEISELGAAMWSQSSTTTGFVVGSLDPFNPCILNGLTYHSSLCNYAYNFSFYNSPIISRNCLFMDIYNMCPFPVSNANSGPVGLFNNIMINCGAITYNTRHGMSAPYYIQHNVSQVGISIYPGGNNFLNNYDTSVKQNIFDGSYYCLYSTFPIASTKSGVGRILVSKNLIKSNMQIPITGMVSSDLYDSDSFILNGKDTSIRANRWEYTGIFGSIGYTTNSILEPFGVIQYNKYDATISHVQGGIFIKYPNTDYTRFYSRSYYYGLSAPNAYCIIAGATINKQSNESVFINVGLVFKISSDLYYQNVGARIGGGLPYLVVLQDGIEIDRQIITTRTLEYMEFSYTKELISKGSYNIYITTSSFIGYIDIKKAYCNIGGTSKYTKVLADTFTMLNDGIYDRVLDTIKDTSPYLNSGDVNNVTDVRVYRKISGV